MLTLDEKARFCSLAALLLAPPDDALIDELRDEQMRALLAKARQELGGNGLPPAPILSTLKAEYARPFGQWEGEAISLVESTHKPWTTDGECKMVFSASTGLLMGDSALHMRELYRQSDLEVPAEFGSMPDHLVLELEFLGLLYRAASQRQIEGFIGDHLGWITELQAQMEEAVSHPFYRGVVELIRCFLEKEKTPLRQQDRAIGHSGGSRNPDVIPAKAGNQSALDAGSSPA